MLSKYSYIDKISILEGKGSTIVQFAMIQSLALGGSVSHHLPPYIEWNVKNINCTYCWKL